MKKIVITESQMKMLLEISTNAINVEMKNVNLHPTDPQKEAGNYKMGHISIKGMKISIENPAGSIRKFKKDDGTTGQVTMKNHYGYFGGTSGNGKDGDAVDVFIGPNPEGFERVYVIDQNAKDGSFDESKVMIGFDSKEEAKNAYMANYNPGWKGFRTITGVSLKLFKKWLYRGNKQRKPFAEYVEIQRKKLEESRYSQETYDGYNVPKQLEKVITALKYSHDKEIEIKISYTNGYCSTYNWDQKKIISFLNKLNSGELGNDRLVATYYTTMPKFSIFVKVGTQDERTNIDNYNKQFN